LQKFGIGNCFAGDEWGEGMNLLWRAIIRNTFLEGLKHHEDFVTFALFGGVIKKEIQYLKSETVEYSK